MKIVVNRGSPVPPRSQIAIQVEVGIVTGQLEPGRKLPSIRELARRAKVHANTVAAAYAELTERGLVESRRGSGLFVSRRGPSPPTEACELDDLIASFLEMARSRGYSIAEIRQAIQSWLQQQPADHVLVVEPAPDIRAILRDELAGTLPCRVEAVDLAALDEPGILEASLVVCSFYHTVAIHERIGVTHPMVTINLNPGNTELEQLRKLPPGEMLGIVSSSPILLTTVTSVISALRGDDILVRPVPLSDEAEWKLVARTADAVICDSVAGARVKPFVRKRLRIIRLVPEETLAQLREYFG